MQVEQTREVGGDGRVGGDSSARGPIQHSLCARHWAQHLDTLVYLMLKEILCLGTLISPVLQMRGPGTERSNDPPEVAQLIIDEAGWQTQKVRIQSPPFQLLLS